jgi:hypothetical protein
MQSSWAIDSLVIVYFLTQQPTDLAADLYWNSSRAPRPSKREKGKSKCISAYNEIPGRRDIIDMKWFPFPKSRSTAIYFHLQYGPDANAVKVKGISSLKKQTNLTEAPGKVQEIWFPILELI